MFKKIAANTEAKNVVDDGVHRAVQKNNKDQKTKYYFMCAQGFAESRTPVQLVRCLELWSAGPFYLVGRWIGRRRKETKKTKTTR